MSMTKIERGLYLVTAIIVVDGHVHPEERELFELMVENLGVALDTVNHLRMVLDGAVAFDVEETIQQIARGVGSSEIAELVREGYLTAAVDGSIDQAECAVIDRLLSAAGIPEARWPLLHAWGRMCVEQMTLGVGLLASHP